MQHGDLTLGGAHLGVVTAEQKLVQDLSHWFVERMGTDARHPGYGSLLDGGTKPNGQEVDSLIGSDDFQFTATLIESDIRRIVQEYQARQLERAKSDRLRYNKTTLTGGELLISLNEVALFQDQDTLKVTLHITTGSNRSITVDVPIPPV